MWEARSGERVAVEAPQGAVVELERSPCAEGEAKTRNEGLCKGSYVERSQPESWVGGPPSLVRGDPTVHLGGGESAWSQVTWVLGKDTIAGLGGGVEGTGEMPTDFVLSPICMTVQVPALRSGRRS